MGDLYYHVVANHTGKYCDFPKHRTVHTETAVSNIGQHCSKYIGVCGLDEARSFYDRAELLAAVTEGLDVAPTGKKAAVVGEERCSSPRTLLVTASYSRLLHVHDWYRGRLAGRSQPALRLEMWNEKERVAQGVRLPGKIASAAIQSALFRCRTTCALVGMAEHILAANAV